MSTALATQTRGTAITADMTGMRRVGLVRPTNNPAEVLAAHKAIAEMVSEVLEPGVDYGEIPGTDGKQALLKAGAERLAFGIGATIQLEIIEREVDHAAEFDWTKRQKEWSGPKQARRFKWVETTGTSRGLYRYVVRARLVRREDGATIGEGIGSCSTMESKYVDRPRDSENTVLKMAKKRAAVDAVLSTLALTGRFVPDDLDDTEEADADGAVKDPTDGLTLAEALKIEVRGTALGDHAPKGLTSILGWAEGVLHEEPENPRMLRLQAAVKMVIVKRLADEARTAEATADTSATESEGQASVDGWGL